MDPQHLVVWNSCVSQIQNENWSKKNKTLLPVLATMLYPKWACLILLKPELNSFHALPIGGYVFCLDPNKEAPPSRLFSDETLLIIKAVQGLEDTQGLNRRQLAKAQSVQMYTGREAPRPRLLKGMYSRLTTDILRNILEAAATK